MGQRGHKGTSGYKARIHVYPGRGTSRTTGNKGVQNAGTHVPLRHTLGASTLGECLPGARPARYF